MITLIRNDWCWGHRRYFGAAMSSIVHTATDLPDDFEYPKHLDPGYVSVQHCIVSDFHGIPSDSKVFGDPVDRAVLADNAFKRLVQPVEGDHCTPVVYFYGFLPRYLTAFGATVAA